MTRSLNSRIATLAGGLAAIAATMAILLSGAASINGANSSSTAGSGVDFVLETPETVPDFEPDSTAGETEGAMPFEEPAGNTNGTTEPGSQDTTVRRVTPDEFSFPSEVQTQPLERIEPRQPLSDAKPLKEVAATSVLPRPIALSAGTIRFGEKSVLLDGLTETPVDRTCTDTNGKAWPCGMMARTALRNFLRGRALTCSVPDPEWEGTVTAACTLAGKDVGLWLAENGWAEALPGSSFEQQGQEAKAEKRGLFGDDPRRGMEVAPLEDSLVP